VIVVNGPKKYWNQSDPYNPNTWGRVPRPHGEARYAMRLVYGDAPLASIRQKDRSEFDNLVVEVPVAVLPPWRAWRLWIRALPSF